MFRVAVTGEVGRHHLAGSALLVHGDVQAGAGGRQGAQVGGEPGGRVAGAPGRGQLPPAAARSAAKLRTKARWIRSLSPLCRAATR